ncbi:hypothetical protein L1D09_00570 [Vibrio tubiashii]|uniref:hypothetical protein n=1 Tax=Vibrio tubiashii TaxID=29498 RepID=UPI001EFE2AF6|nr:hypothetical protein [Vibrio tubiashii]MCG9580013.1 hypothetical protein [Vibrio tubiashii]MCG9613604.1 hypothetical protein [Vibrio tubiashii]
MSSTLTDEINKDLGIATSEDSLPEGPEAIERAVELALEKVNALLYLSTSFLVFGVLVVLLATYLFKKGYKAEDIVKVMSLPLIIVSGVFLIVAGYSTEQIAPVMALLSAIAGYLLGNHQSIKQINDSSEPKE